MWSLRCSLSFFSRRVYAEGCFRMFAISARSAEVVSGPILVVGRGVTLFRHFVVLCSSLLQLFFGVPTALAGGGETFGVPGGGLGGRVVTVVSELRGPTRFVARFPTGSECELQKSVAAVAGCACYECGLEKAKGKGGYVKRPRGREAEAGFSHQGKEATSRREESPPSNGFQIRLKSQDHPCHEQGCSRREAAVTICTGSHLRRFGLVLVFAVLQDEGGLHRFDVL
ncbi:hypothetical protein Taro_031875 [Colocasia esculenta]|uniref:Uncharacterized protein n=1 Tax=Colocasia esculenta TaxID=4460 RepID=A0A843W069_COLES|nr:hypothetical protein [Colocasia esculenta]